MKNYLVTYDLNRTGQNYEALIDAIQKYRCVHAMQSVWFIKSDSDADAIYNYLHQKMDSNDHIFISEITPNRQGWMDQKVWDFIKS